MRNTIRSCWVLFLLLLVLFQPQRALAAGTLTLSSVSGAKGETVQVAVHLKSSDICSGNFDVCYPAAELELLRAEASFGFCVVNPTAAGTVRVSFAASAPLTDTELCTLTFRITEATPTGGSAITATNVRFYNANAESIQAQTLAGSVCKSAVEVRIVSAKTAEYQAVSVQVELGGTLRPAGGNFTLTYDPACFTVCSVLPGGNLNGVSFTSHTEKAGVLHVAFSAARPVAQGTLCSVVLQTVTGKEQTSAITLSQAKMYDEQAAALETTLRSSSVSITAPSDRDPKLWITGGALQDGGISEAGVVLQGRGTVCGGNFVLEYDSRMELDAEPARPEVVIQKQPGQLVVSWGSSVAYSDEALLCRLHVTKALEGAQIGIQSVRLYDAQSAAIDVVDVRPATIQSNSGVTAVIDTVTVQKESGTQTSYAVAVDVADQLLYSTPTGRVLPVLALYEGQKLVALSANGDESASLRGGVGELTLSARTGSSVTALRVFVLDGGQDTFLPLCTALWQSVRSSES